MERLIVVSNRLPFTLDRGEAGEWAAKPSSGGLVTGLVPILEDRGGLWIGWSGTTSPAAEVEGALDLATEGSGYQVVPVELNEEERDQFYYGYSNEVIWPLFHDLQVLCNFDHAYWDTYLEVNSRFADTVEKKVRPGDFVWIHDYQLICVGEALRQRGVRNKLGFFLHIPFPPLDIFLKLPQQAEVMKALLQHDLLGFQTNRDLRNFLQCARRVQGLSVSQKEGRQVLHWEGREIGTGSFPIGIDTKHFAKTAALEDVSRRAWNIHAGFPDRQLILGVDRLDYTKGIPDRLKAFRNALERHPELCQRVTFIQVVVPSRTDIPKYHTLKSEIDQLVGEINGEFSAGNWVPIHYIFRSLDFLELLAYYRTAEIALITPHKDGMNLVAKEYCACSLEENSVLILSQFAGAADQLRKGALLVNPYDVERTADAIYKAYRMKPRERQTRMRRLRAQVEQEDIFWWVRSFFEAVPEAAAKKATRKVAKKAG